MKPMKLKPAFKDYLWGGTLLIDKYGKKTDLRPVAESWEVSIHPDGTSEVINGEHAGQLLSEVLSAHPEFVSNKKEVLPILIKLIDAKQSLSVQVHPADEYARKVENDNGKNEIWYVLEAEPTASLMIGFSRAVTKAEIKERIENNTLLEICREIPVKAGDCYAIPAGMLHAIGAGTVIAEVQQSSNVTYRVYDYDRRDAAGNARELHVEKALDVLDSTLTSENLANKSSHLAAGCSVTPLVEWEYFYTEKIQVQTISYHKVLEGSFHALLCLEGNLILKQAGEEISLEKGESAFLPAGMGDYTLTGPGTCMVVKLTAE